MLALSDNVAIAADAIRAHKLRVALTVLGLTMGVATLITVMTLVQGANVYVEQKFANLGTNVFRISRMPFAVTDFSLYIKAQRYKKILMDDLRAVGEGCPHCQYVGTSVSSTLDARYQNHEVQDVTLYGHTPNMAEIDTRTVVRGRYFTQIEDQHSAQVCLIGDRLASEFFLGLDPVGRTIRLESTEFLVIGVFEKIGSILGMDQDNFAVIPLNTYLKFRGLRNSLMLQVKTDGDRDFKLAQDEARTILRGRRHIPPNGEEDFFVGTADSYIDLWKSVSSAFFAVFVMVSSISAVVGGIVIMNVMLVSVTERTKEIGVRRAMGATQRDILRQFLAESVMQCIVGGAIGVVIGFGCALALRTFTEFPAAVQAWVAVLGVVLSCGIGLFFGIYPATRAAQLDPVAALRAE
jgi:putative ABC transport system permease protein